MRNSVRRLSISIVVVFVLASCCSAQTFRYWIDKGHQRGVTQKEQQERIVSAMDQFEIVADLDFEQTKDRSKSHFKFQFYTESQLESAFGRLYDGNIVGLNRTRKFNTAPYSWTIENVSIHEVAHSKLLRRAMSGSLPYGHSSEVGSVMNGSLNAVWFSPTDVKGLQRKFGKPDKEFYPKDKSTVGREVRRLTAEWKLLRDARNAEKNVPKRKALDKRTKAKHKEVVKSRVKWFQMKDRWASVPMAK